MACSRAFRATISISRLRAVRLRAMGLQARLDARFENCAASRSGDRASATHGRRIPEGSRPSPSSSDELPPESASLRERRRRGVRASASEVEDERGTGLQQAKRARTAKKSNQPSFAPRGDAGDRRADQDDERAGDVRDENARRVEDAHVKRHDARRCLARRYLRPNLGQLIFHNRACPQTRVSANLQGSLADSNYTRGCLDR